MPNIKRGRIPYFSFIEMLLRKCVELLPFSGLPIISTTCFLRWV